MLWEMVRIALCLGLPMVGIVLTVLWMSVWAEPSFGSIAGLVIAVVALIYGAKTSWDVWQKLAQAGRKRAVVHVQP